MSKPTVLIAEDESALVTLLRYNLEREGYRVLEARDGEEALLVAAEEKPDLVILDWMMPQLSGIEVCRRLRRDAATRDIRDDDARGRHTTTGRSLHRMLAGGWLIDTPGMRGLGLAEVGFGIDATFPEISDLAAHCKFRDCAHEREPGCAVQAAVAAGAIDPDRLARFKKLKSENTQATEAIALARDKVRKQGRTAKGSKKPRQKS